MQQKGFSLVELSIVLVILGLLTGGILAGQSLIRAAELRSVSTDFARYKTAVASFRDKYFGLPGDITNATKFWGADTASACSESPVAGDRVAKTATCDGTGNGMIGDNIGKANEHFRAWQQLANAGLIEGSYTGVAGSLTNRHAVIGQNVPASRLKNAGFSFMYASYTSAHAQRFINASDKNLIEFGAASDTSGGYELYHPVLKPEEAWNIDVKMDDGKPATGMLNVWKSTCATTTDPATAVYALNVTAADCNFDYQIGL